jgi:phosphatidylglycerophosphatase A
VTGRDLGVSDHGSMVWDEVVAFLPLAALASASIVLQAIAFVLFRLFDIWKPFPIREPRAPIEGRARRDGG